LSALFRLIAFFRIILYKIMTICVKKRNKFFSSSEETCHRIHMKPAKKSVDILVIADQERLHALFEPGGELAGASIRKAFTVDDGLKSATLETPSLLFFQGRMGGFSAEIIARHIRLELKDLKTRLVMFCAPEDLADAGMKFLYAKVDSSLSDGQLAEQVRSIITSHMSGGKKARYRANKRPVGNITPAGRFKRGDVETTADASETTKQGVEMSSDSSRMETPDSGRAVSESAEKTEDIVEIRTREFPSADSGDVISISEVKTVHAANFHDALESAMETAAEDMPVSDQSQEEPVYTEFHPEQSDPPQGHTPLPTETDVSSGGRIRGIVAAVVVLSVCGLIFLYYGLQTPVERNETPVAISSGKSATDGGSVTPSAPDIKELNKSEANYRPVSAKKQRPEGYVSYRVRRGDTILYILTARFGFSAKRAANLLPEILEKNGMEKNAVLAIGQTIFVPASL
jgi:hypothetical protein